jgi:hypothetical protein
MNFLAAVFFLFYTQFDRILLGKIQIIDILRNPSASIPLLIWSAISLGALYYLFRVVLSVMKDDWMIIYQRFIRYILLFTIVSILCNFFFNLANYSDSEYSLLSNILYTIKTDTSSMFDMRNRLDVIKRIFLFGNLLTLFIYYRGLNRKKADTSLI